MSSLAAALRHPSTRPQPPSSLFSPLPRTVTKQTNMSEVHSPSSATSLMLRHTTCALRYRTAWRELLHPLPGWARRAQWLKRDTVEMNEAVLREPYYRIKSYAQPAAYTSPSLHVDPAVREPATHQSSNYAVEAQLRRPRQVLSPERLQELREQLQFTGATGPSPVSGAAPTFADEYGDRLRPRYPESWDTVPPHQPSRSKA